MSENLATAHAFHPGDRVSATMNGRRRVLTIVGIALSPEFIYVLGPGQLVPDDRTFGILWFDRFTLEAAYDLKGAFNNVSIGLMPSASEPEVIAQTDAILNRVASIEGVRPYGDPVDRLPHLVCMGIDGIEPQAVLLGLDQAGIAAHSGSACSSEALEPSPVLEAMGVDAHRSLRVSVGWNTTDRDIERFLDELPRVVSKLRALAG